MSKFPEGTAEKTIKVTATTTAEKVEFSPAFTTFNVKGFKGVEVPVILTAVSASLEINTTDAVGVAVIDFSLTKPMDSDLEIKCDYESAVDFVGIDGVVWNPSPLVIKQGELTLKLSITVPQGRIGSLPIKISCANAGVDVQTKSMKFMFYQVERSEVSISTFSTAVSVSGIDVVKAIDVKLTKVAEGSVTVNLAVTSNNTLKGVLSVSQVVFAKGDLTKPVDITFAAADFIHGTSAGVTVTATSPDANIKPSAAALVFNVSGPPAKEDLQIKWSPDLTDLIFLPGETADKKVSIYFETKDQVKAQNTVTMVPTITGFDAADYTIFEETATIAANSHFGWYLMMIKPSSKGKTMNISFASDEATFLETQPSEYVITSKALTPPADKYKSNIGITVGGLKEIQHIATDRAKNFYLTVSTADGTIPAGPSIVDLVVTGFAAEDYYFWNNPFILSANSYSLYIEIRSSAAGKTGVVTPISDYVTIASDAAVTFFVE